MAPAATSPATIPLSSNLLPTSGTSSFPSNALPSATHSALLAHLQATQSIAPLDAILTESLARNGWIDRVRALALDLLRSGECETFPELMGEVLRRATIPQPGTTGAAVVGQAKAGMNGATMKAQIKANDNNTTAVNGNGVVNGSSQNGATGSIVLATGSPIGPDGLPDVRIPAKTVEEGVGFLRERIRDLVEVVEEEGHSAPVPV